MLNHQANKQDVNASDLTKMIHEYFRELLEGKIGKDNPVNHERLSLISDLFGELDKLSIEQIKAFYQLLKEFDNK